MFAFFVKTVGRAVFGKRVVISSHPFRCFLLRRRVLLPRASSQVELERLNENIVSGAEESSHPQARNEIQAQDSSEHYCGYESVCSETRQHENVSPWCCGRPFCADANPYPVPFTPPGWFPFYGPRT